MEDKKPEQKPERKRIHLTGGGTMNIFDHRKSGLPKTAQLMRQTNHRTWLDLRMRGGDGMHFLMQKYPHLMAQLEFLTGSWLLAGKSILASKEVLEDYLTNTRILMEVIQRSPLRMPDATSSAEELAMYKQQMQKLLVFLEQEVLPVIPESPQREELTLPDGEGIEQSDGEEPEFKEETNSSQEETED